VVLSKQRDQFDPHVLRLVFASILFTVFSELAFTFHVDVYGLLNLTGHFLKLVSFYLIYKALVETGLTRPYDLLFTSLKKNEEELRSERDNLKKAMAEVNTLRGILPICSYCKRIRDDDGHYHQMESYIHEHSDADFSHGVCPECAKEHFPDMDLGGEAVQSVR